MSRHDRDALDGGTRTPLPAELDALVETATSDSNDPSRQAARRGLLSIAIETIATGDPVPASLRNWLVPALRSLHDALESNGRINDPWESNDVIEDGAPQHDETTQRNQLKAALGSLGQAMKGRPVTDDKLVADLRVAAAVHLLSRYLNKSKAIEAVAVGLGWDDSTVERSCELTQFLDGKDVPQTVEGLARPVIERMRRPETQLHLYPQEFRDFLRVTQPGAS